jgi:hypothetical protein
MDVSHVRQRVQAIADALPDDEVQRSLDDQGDEQLALVNKVIDGRDHGVGRSCQDHSIVIVLILDSMITWG